MMMMIMMFCELRNFCLRGTPQHSSL